MREGATLGPYRIVREIGSGSFGSVLLGRDEATGVEVAIKTVTVPSENRVSSLRREIQALARVRHPGVARIRDDGVTSRGPWYAMDLVEGRTLLRYVRGLADASLETSVDLQASTEVLAASLQATRVVASDGTEVLSSSGSSSSGPGQALLGPPSTPEARPRILTIVRRLCAPLSYLHGEGILHRDLKPDNVLVTADGMPVIVDFGLTSEAFDAQLRETMEVVGEVAGTALYMAPEQARGELLDARADLYALGCILYQLLTGRPPFLAESAVQVLLMHVTQAPVPPTVLCQDLDPRVDDVVLRLLAKDPRERLGHADDVAHALLALGAANEPLAGPAPRTYLYRPALAGREEIIAAIDEPVGRLREDRGGMVLLCGEAGAGKTRLLKEVGRRAGKLGHRVIGSDCATARDGGKPLQGFRGVFEAIADRCRERGPGEAERLLGVQAAILAPYDSGVRRLSDSLGMRTPATLSPEAALARLHRSLAEVIANLARTQRLVLLMDDVHEADELTLGALRHLWRTKLCASCPFVVVASFRPEESGEDLDGLRDDESVLNVALERLDDDAIANVAADMLALWPLPDGFRRFLVDSAEGNPFFVAQYLRTAVAEGLLLRDASGQWRMRRVDVSQAQPLEDALPLPATLRDLAVRRLAGLSPTARAVLEHSSVLGRDVDGALLALVSGLEELRIAEGVAELVRRHCVMETGDGLRFRHATLRDVAYESVAADARVAMHRRAAECLESAGRARETLPALALHWERAGATDRAVACYAEAARAARGRYAWRESEQLLRSLLRLCPEPSLHRTAAHASLGSVLTHRGRFAEAVQEHALGLEDARAIGDARWEGRSLVDIAGAEQILGDAERARARYEAGIAILHAIGEQRLEANAIENLAVLLQNAGVTQAAEACHQSALGMFRELGSVNGQLTALTNLGGLRAEQGRWQEAIAIMEEGLALARASGERESEALLTGNIGSIRHARGWLREARDFYDRARPIFHEIGGRLGEATLLANLAHLALEQGHTADARLLLSESRALSEEIGGLRQLTFVRLIEGWLAEAEGRYDAASAAYREALRRIEGKGPLLESLAWLALGALETTLGRCDAAEQSLRGAVRLLEGQDDALMHAAVDIARARLLRRSGGSRDERRTLLLAIEIKLRELVELLRLAECLCEQGHLLLEEGGDATRLLDEAMSLVDQGGAGPGSPARQRIDELARAIAYGPRGGPGTVR